jgi:transcriptional regulator GlxA family with amidase domain
VQVAIGLYEGFTALDVIGPYQVLSNVPGTEVRFCAAQAGIVKDDNGLLRVDVEHSFDDIPSPEILLVGGGLSTRRYARDGEPIVEWIRAAHPDTTYTTSVCTGSLLLGAAGVLDGLRATSHWFAYDHLRKFGAEATEQRVVWEGKVVTAAGVSAGIDLALTLVGTMHGDEVAQAVQLGIEYDPQPPYDAGAPSKAPAPIRELVEAIMADAEAKAVATAP